MNSNMEKPYVVGIDIGGTNTVFGIVDARGTIIASSSIKTAGAQRGQGELVRSPCASKKRSSHRFRRATKQAFPFGNAVQWID